MTPPRDRASDSQYRRFAERFVDLVIDPKRPWLLRYILMGGLDRIPTEDEIDSGAPRLIPAEPEDS
jgi:hypothetical protein